MGTKFCRDRRPNLTKKSDQIIFMRCAAKADSCTTANFSEGALTPDGSRRRSIMPRTDDCACVRAEVRHPKFWMLLGLIAKMSECFCALDHPQWRLQTSLFNFFAPTTSLCYSNGMQNRENEVSKVVRGASAGVNPETATCAAENCLIATRARGRLLSGDFTGLIKRTDETGAP